MVAQFRAKVGGDRFRDLQGGEVDAGRPERAPSQRRCGDTASVRAIEQRSDLPVALHAVGKAGPAGALAWAEDRSHEGKDARGLNEQPGLLLRQMSLVQIGQRRFKIVIHQRDGHGGRTFHHANAQLTQGGAKLRFAPHLDRLNAHTAFLEASFRDFGC